MASHQGVLTLALTVVLLALPSLNYEVTLHMRPTSSNTSCPTHPCHTLSEYVQDPGHYFNDSSLTLQFLPSNHTFDAFNASLIITSIHQLELLGNSSAMLPTRIVCSSHVGLTFNDISKVKIDGLAFVYCARSHVVQVSNGDGSFTTYYGLYLQSVQTAEIIDCSFRESYGSALGVVDSHVVLTGNNSFLNNCRLCPTELCGSQGPKCYGGGVYAHMSSLSFTGRSIFFGNLAYSGGEMYTEAGSIVHISENTTFIGNSATYGGGVYAWNSNVHISENTTCDGPTEKISAYLDHWLQPLAKSLPSYIKDTNEFVKYIESTKLPKDCILCTLDVSSLYTNIPTEDGIHAALQAIENWDNKDPLCPPTS